MTLVARDFMDEVLLPFMLGQPRLVEAIKNWPPSEQVLDEIGYYIKGDALRELAVHAHIAKYATTYNQFSKTIVAQALAYLVFFADSLAEKDRDFFKNYCDAIEEFFGDADEQRKNYLIDSFERIDMKFLPNFQPPIPK